MNIEYTYTQKKSLGAIHSGCLAFQTIFDLHIPNILFILKIILGKQSPILVNQPNNRISFLFMPHTIRPLELTMYAHGYSHN